MREALCGCKERPAEERRNPEALLALTPSGSRLKRFLDQDIRTEWFEAVYDVEYKLRQLIGNNRGVSVVAFYAASHGLAVVLLIRLLLNW